MRAAIQAKWPNDLLRVQNAAEFVLRPARAARVRKYEREETPTQPTADSEPELKKVDRLEPER
ncbi:MAG TPA: hypothetical protein VNW72_06410 [Chthoniobacterales bacterium]|nr:hypothetical protein [Chthoniobacterales bacterium]